MARRQCSPRRIPIRWGLSGWVPPPFTWLCRWRSPACVRTWRRPCRQPWYVAEIVALLLIFISTTFSAALLAFPDLHQKRRLALAPVAMFGLFLLVLLLAWRADYPPAPLPVHSFMCTCSIILVSLLPMAWMLYTLRRFASTHYQLAGAIALLSAFSIGALWLRLHEVNDSVVHVLEWHYLPMLAVGLAGLWLGKLLLRW